MTTKRLGRVVQVHTDNGKAAASIQLLNEEKSLDKVMIGKPSANAQWVPKQDWTVIVEEHPTGDSYITGVFDIPEEYDMPVPGPGGMTFRFGPDTQLTFAPDGSGGFDVTLSGTNVHVQGADSVEIDSSSVSLAGGTKALLTDVTTSTDADGHVTSIDKEKTQNVTGK